VESAADVLRNWEAIKASERAEEGEAHRSTLEGVPITLPALARAQELADRAARIGFDRSDPEGLWATIREETAALRARRDADDQARELGDLLFSLADVARWLGLDAESALRGACDRFVRRHVEMERATRASGTI
jgi:uncharacterized protein YabN with tetrapyrrole methylase and pyrophosphatase domain